MPRQWSAGLAFHQSMDSVPSLRSARLVLLPDCRTSVSSESPTPSDAPGEGDEDPPGRHPSRRFNELYPAALSAPRRPTSGNAPAAAMNQVPHTVHYSVSPPDPSEELGPGLGWLGGVAIALLTLLVPLTSVVLDREDQPTGSTLPRVTNSLQRHGSHNPSGLSSTGFGESPGGDTGGKPQ
jgi:hypothetical protein